jgi:hypothetical protein
MKKTNRLIVGSAFSLAAIAVAIDHTQHRLPEAVPVTQEQAGMSDEEESPCGMAAEESPCSMDSDDSDSSPCGLGD